MCNGIRIVATGLDVPEKIMSSEDFEKIVETSDEWIRTRTGIKNRHFLCAGETHLDMAMRAALKAIDSAGIDRQQIGTVLVATFASDQYVPSCAALLQERLGLSEDVLAYDLNAACSGFMFGLESVRGILSVSEKPYALLVGAEALSRRLDMTDRSTCILFGDGAGAAIVEKSDRPAVISCRTRGDITKILVDRYVHMDGQGVYKFAVKEVPKLIEEVLAKAGVSADEVDHFICHQANARILQSVAKSLDQPMEKFYQNLQEFGNTSAASVPIVMAQMNDLGLLKRGERVVLAGFGAGLTWSVATFLW
ncbi:MAG: ketoacyl-ACP synthase III [Lachnospiraceae bacterium]|nr:ketoacyl-ACP synthase III [Lachnospiraceae bacterium]